MLDHLVFWRVGGISMSGSKRGSRLGVGSFYVNFLNRNIRYIYYVDIELGGR